MTARRPSSLRARLTWWYAALLGVPLAAFAVVTYVLFARTLVSRTDRFISDALGVFEREVGAERRVRASARDALTTTADEVRFRNLRIIVLDAAGTVVAMHEEPSTAGDGSAERVVTALRDPASPSTAMTVRGPDGGDRVVTHDLVVDGEVYRLSGAFPLADVEAVLERTRLVFASLIPALLVLAAAAAWFLARRGLAPVEAMAARAGEITASNLEARLPVAGDAELTGLARVINELLDRLEGAFAQQRRFMADASHELRTPTAVIRAEADVTLARPSRTEPEYRESLGVIHAAARRLTRLVDDLFLLARTDSGHLELRLAPIYLEEVVDDAVRAMEPVAAARGVQVEVRQMVQAPYVGDADLLGRVILNLLDNAVKHSPSGGTLTVEMAHDAGSFVISVTDTGPGIPVAEHELVFERFRRGSAPRRDVDGPPDGAGLGLSIARRIAEAHGGRLELRASRPGHTEFRLALPASSPASSPAS